VAKRSRLLGKACGRCARENQALKLQRRFGRKGVLLSFLYQCIPGNSNFWACQEKDCSVHTECRRFLYAADLEETGQAKTPFRAAFLGARIQCSQCELQTSGGTLKSRFGRVERARFIWEFGPKKLGPTLSFRTFRRRWLSSHGWNWNANFCQAEGKIDSNVRCSPRENSCVAA